MSDSFAVWEVILRAFGVAWALLICANLALAARGAATPTLGWRTCAPLILTFLAWASYFSCSTAGNLCGASVWLWPAVALNLAFPFALWWLSRVLLGDDLSWPAPLALAALFGLLAAGSVAVYFGQPKAAWLQKLFAYGFLTLSFVQIWRGEAGDLIEQRRSLRHFVIGIVGAYSALVLAVELWLGASGGQPPVWLMWLHLLAMNAGLITAAIWLLQPSRAARSWLGSVRTRAAAQMTLRLNEPETAQTTPEVRVDETAFPQLATSKPAASAALTSLAARAVQVMAEQQLHHDSELSLAALAKSLATPQYLLRRAIHENLGHRNFASFVNDARLTEVALRLSDAALDRRPILTLALEAGFGSIGAFNRAFRERFDCTPSEYRQQRRLLP